MITFFGGDDNRERHFRKQPPLDKDNFFKKVCNFNFKDLSRKIYELKLEEAERQKEEAAKHEALLDKLKYLEWTLYDLKQDYERFTNQNKKEGDEK